MPLGLSWTSTIALTAFLTTAVPRLLYFVNGLRQIFRLSKDISEFYGKMFDLNWGRILYNSPEDQGWLNFGYWPAKSYGHACENLLHRMLDRCELKHAETLLDIGCGRGKSTCIIASEHPKLRIHAVDLTPSHIDVANSRAKDLGLTDVTFVVDSATILKTVLDNSQDVVCALECAFHFDTREEFLRQAFRVLKPGGRLVVADIVASQATKLVRSVVDNIGAVKELNDEMSRAIGVPPANVYGTSKYKKILQECGFGSINIEDITTEASWGFSKHALARLALYRSLHTDEKVEPIFEAWLEHMCWYLLPITGVYILVSAVKPKAGGGTNEGM